MNKSENINELALALSCLQGEIIDAHKDTQGHGYKYATLGSVLEIARPLLAKNNLSVTQLCGTVGDKISVETVLMHASGQWISETLAFDVPEKSRNNKAQDSGGVITYMRRYSLTALLGITQTDDDAAIKEEAPKKQATPTPQPVSPKPVELVHPETLSELGHYLLAFEVPQEKVQSWFTGLHKRGLTKDATIDLTKIPQEYALKLIAHYKQLEKNTQQSEEDKGQWEQANE